MKLFISSGFANFLAVLAVLFACAGAVGWMILETQNELFLTQVNIGNETRVTTTSKVDGELPSSWKTYRSEIYGYEFQYPAEWRATGDDLYLVFRPIVGSDNERVALTFDLACVFATGFEDQAVTIRSGDAIYGQNTLHEKKYFVTENGQERLALRILSADFPEWYKDQHNLDFLNRCSGAAFVAGADIDEVKFERILSSFSFPRPQDIFCGGIAGIRCPVGYFCKLDGDYPDAGGECFPVPEKTGNGTLAGTVSIGPICPVERIDAPCPVPPEAYAAREFRVLSGDRSETIATFHANSSGTYSLALQPGTYVVVPAKSGMGFESKDLPATIIVKVSQTTTLNIDVDTGIR